ncbi:IclR family transcriptional regulator [Hoeflea sp. TYP-13]|uniref:IclR family transcriptional regulator n=1 Tax=Hoeflea sp. TYP-13 TaxID=3230023 RepID=UPI0034C61EB9
MATRDQSPGENNGGQIDTRKGVQSVDRAFAILRVMEEADRPLAVKELSELCGMPPSKVHHYLVSLVRSAVVRQNSNGNYDLGPFALHLGMSALRRLDTIALGSRAAEALRDKTGEAVFVAVWGSHGATIVRYFEGFRPVTVEVRAGLILPVFTSATGRVFLAWGNAGQVEAVGQREQTRTGNEIEQIRAETMSSGLGRVDGDLLPRIASLSAPVFDRDDRLALALTSLGWIEEFDTDPDGEIAEALKDAASSLSKELGNTSR